MTDGPSVELSAALRVARRYGRTSDDPVVLQRTNNLVVWLRPHEIVAKVAGSSDNEPGLLLEHEVAAALTSAGAPVGPPMPGTEPTRDDDTGHLVTLWTRMAQEQTGDIEPGRIGRSLRVLHVGLARFGGDLPSFLHKLDRARTALADDRLMAALREPERSMLRAAFDRGRGMLDEHAYGQQTLHGEPHSANVLDTPDGLRWIDLEGVCVGPLEWDLAFVSDEAIPAFPTVDTGLLTVLRTLNSARVATWCWARWELEEMRGHARFHLERVRDASV